MEERGREGEGGTEGKGRRGWNRGREGSEEGEQKLEGKGKGREMGGGGGVGDEEQGEVLYSKLGKGHKRI